MAARTAGPDRHHPPAPALPAVRRARRRRPRHVRGLPLVAAAQPLRLPALRDPAGGARHLRPLPAARAAAALRPRRLRLRPAGGWPAGALQVPWRPGRRTPAGRPAGRDPGRRRAPAGAGAGPAAPQPPAPARLRPGAGTGAAAGAGHRGAAGGRTAAAAPAHRGAVRAGRDGAAAHPARRVPGGGAGAAAGARGPGGRRHDHRRHPAGRGPGAAPGRGGTGRRLDMRAYALTGGAAAPAPAGTLGGRPRAAAPRTSSMPERKRKTPATVTILDVARHAGVSAMTASRVINGNTRVGAELRERVLASVQALGYCPNLAGRSLRTRGSARIGVLYSNPSAAYLNELMLGMLEQSSLSGTQVLVEKCAGLQSQRAAVQRLVEAGVDGVIVPPPLCDSPHTIGE